MPSQIIYATLLVANLATAQIPDRTAKEQETQTQTPTSAPSENLPWQRCMREICGSELDRRDKELNALSREKGAELAAHYQNFLNATEAAMRSEFTETKIQYEALVQAYRQDLKIKNPKILHLYELIQTLDRLKKIEWNENDTIDEQASRQKLTDISQIEIAHLFKFAGTVKKVIQSAPKVTSENLDVLRQRMSDADIRKQITAVLATIEREETAISKFFELPRKTLFMEGAWPEHRTRLTAGELNPNSLELLANRYQSVAHISTLLKESSAKTDRPAISLRSVVSADQIKKSESQLKDLTDYLAGRQRSDNPAEIEATSINNECLRAILQVERYFPTAKQIENFRPIEARWRAEFMQKVKGHLSAETSHKAGAFISGLKIGAPQTKEDWLTNTVPILEQIRTAADDQAILETETGRQMHLLGGILAIDKEFKPAAETSDLCLKKGNPSSDNAEGRGDRVSVGAMSVTNIDGGRAVEFHEYSHILSDFLKRKGNASTHSLKKNEVWRTCLKEGHGGSKKYLEEDFADLLAFNLTGSPINMFCQKMDDWYQAAFTTVQADEDDVHSTGLYRILHSRLILGDIPKVCHDALEAKGEKFTLKKCMNP